jgi:CRISPR-associated Csx11 family protein
MSSFNLPEKLGKHRPLLLACEAIGWLHMTGKAKADFLRSHGGQDNYDYKRWHEQETPPFPWDDLLKWVRDNFDLKEDFSLPNDPWLGTLTEFLTGHTGRNGGILGLLQAGHAMASGIEKNLPKATSEYLGQDATHMWLSTAFGQPVRNLLAEPPELLTETGWKRLLEQIEELLTELKRLGGQGFSNCLDDWWGWRDGAVGPDGWLRKAFTSTLAETRLPNNDVTLFDQSYVAAALFKSAVAGAVLEGNSFPWNDSGVKQLTRWRLLTVGIGINHYESRAVKIGDWTGTRLVLDEFFDRVRKLVEVDLAVGSLLYADGEVCVFSFPGERFDHDGGDLQIEEWKKWLIDQIDSYAREAKLETPPYCSISEPSRSLVGMTEEIRKARVTVAVPLFRNWEIPDVDSSTEGHVCPVCLVRRNGNEMSKQTPCKTCRDRRTGRLDTWLSGRLGTDTIWITEVADANDRLALITMSLDIEPWLDGTRLDSLRTQAVPEWRNFNPILKNQANPIDPHACFDSLLQYVKGKLKTFDEEDPVLASLQDGYRHEKQRNDSRSDEEIWESFFTKIVEDRADAPEWDSLDDDGRARWLAHQLFRKLASPGRIYRFQRQAEEFFKGLLAQFREIAAADQNRWRTRRLVIKPDNGSSSSWKDRQTYNGRYGDAPISLLYREETKDFITICNLARLLKPGQGRDRLGGIALDLKADDREWEEQTKTLKVGSVSYDVGKLGCYHPVIPLELSPVRFRVLVPLEAASECVDRTIEAWNDQFARVWDRLPLRIGIVAFPRIMPFQAVLEAVRTIEHDINAPSQETWRVAAHETREGVVALDLVRPNGQHDLRTLPVRLPDGREDVFYPYYAVYDTRLRFPLDFQHPNGRIYRHAKDLRNGDDVLVEPSVITTMFMDNAAKRFEPSKRRYLLEWQRMRDLWRLIERFAPSQTALRGAWSELAQCREEWQGPDERWLDGGEKAWLDLVRAVFHDRLGLRSACLATLVKAARDGLLDWCLEWHMTILKKRVGG